MAKGKAEGRAEGAVEGRRAVVRKLLGLRFGALDESADARLERATLEELDEIAERVLSASSLEAALG